MNSSKPSRVGSLKFHSCQSLAKKAPTALGMLCRKYRAADNEDICLERLIEDSKEG
jgi:hypothetical protein